MFTAKGLAEFELEYEVHSKKTSPVTITSQGTIFSAELKETTSPPPNEDAGLSEGEGRGGHEKEGV